MIDKKEFLFLYQKFLSGQATPEEIERLNDYEDNIHLRDDSWIDEGLDKDLVYDMIWKKLGESRNPSRITKKISYLWFKVAAILIITGLAGFFILLPKVKNTGNADALNNKTKFESRKYQAVLTLGNGRVISLDSAKQGRLMNQGGLCVNKAADGQLIYRKDDHTQSANPGNMIWNTIATPNGGQYMVTLSDGSRVLLNAASSLRFPVPFDRNSRNVILSGEAYFEIAKNKRKPFLVTAGETQIKVLGTHFNVNAYTGDSSVAATLLEGSVNFKTSKSTVRLLPGEQGTVSTGKSAIVVKKADLESVMAWKNGYFLLDDTELAVIMKQISRWYDVQVAYAGDFHSKKFGGKISRYSDLSDLLKDMEATGSVHFKQEGRRVTVMP